MLTFHKRVQTHQCEQNYMVYAWSIAYTSNERKTVCEEHIQNTHSNTHTHMYTQFENETKRNGSYLIRFYGV